ncbi:MAG: ABC transporter permease [Allorhizobium sp.]
MMPLVKAELKKLSRQRSTLFWGFLAVPIVATLFKLGLQALVLSHSGRMPPPDADFLLSAGEALNISGNSVAQLLFAIGIASVFYVEYRHSTWRLLVPRFSRTQLWAGKFIACLILLSASLVLTAFGDLLLNIGIALAYGDELSATAFQSGSASSLVLAFAIAFLELAVLAAFVSAITIFARSMIAAVIPAFLLPIGATLAQVYFGRTEDALPLPSLAAGMLRDWLDAPVAITATHTGALTGFAILMLWLVAAAGIGAITFTRQQLASE